MVLFLYERLYSGGVNFINVTYYIFCHICDSVDEKTRKITVFYGKMIGNY